MEFLFHTLQWSWCVNPTIEIKVFFKWICQISFSDFLLCYIFNIALYFYVHCIYIGFVLYSDVECVFSLWWARRFWVHAFLQVHVSLHLFPKSTWVSFCFSRGCLCLLSPHARHHDWWFHLSTSWQSLNCSLKTVTMEIVKSIVTVKKWKSHYFYYYWHNK